MSRITIPVRDSSKYSSPPLPNGIDDLSVDIPLPTWTDPTSIVVWLTAMVTMANGIIVVLHPGYTEPPIVEALVPAVSWLIAGGVIVANIVRHWKATVAAITR